MEEDEEEADTGPLDLSALPGFGDLEKIIAMRRRERDDAAKARHLDRLAEVFAE